MAMPFDRKVQTADRLADAVAELSIADKVFGRDAAANYDRDRLAVTNVMTLTARLLTAVIGATGLQVRLARASLTAKRRNRCKTVSSSHD